MRETVSVSVRMRWWLRWYLAAVMLVSKTTGMAPDWDQVEWWIRRGLVLRTARVTDGN